MKASLELRLQELIPTWIEEMGIESCGCSLVEHPGTWGAAVAFTPSEDPIFYFNRNARLNDLDDDALHALIAHEVGHIHDHLVGKEMVQGNPSFDLSNMNSIEGEDARNEFIRAEYSQNHAQEFSADEYACIQVSPEALIRMLNHLFNLSYPKSKLGPDERKTAFHREHPSHPSYARRIARAQGVMV